MDNLVVGLPRSLLFHEFGELWTAFFENLGITVRHSPQTGKTILDSGTLLAADESCLPLKVYLGHAQTLLEDSSHLFIPRIVQHHRGYYYCAKFAGLPDIVRNTFNLPEAKIISPNIDGWSKFNTVKAVKTVCNVLNVPFIPGWQAYRKALIRLQSAPGLHIQDFGESKIGLVGHSYLLKDNFFCRDIVATLRQRRISYITPGNISNKILYEEAKLFKGEIYWQLSAKIAGAVKLFSRREDVKGIILVSSFCCGPDSLINDFLIEKVLQSSEKPYMIINLDEHTGSAGIITRVEAFLDLVDRRHKS